eukprot:scaffold106_cov109-Isochrysis_galbana.AAC.10
MHTRRSLPWADAKRCACPDHAAAPKVPGNPDLDCTASSRTRPPSCRSCRRPSLLARPAPAAAPPTQAWPGASPTRPGAP